MAYGYILFESQIPRDQAVEQALWQERQNEST
jgi:hypothetical protein